MAFRSSLPQLWLFAAFAACSTTSPPHTPHQQAPTPLGRARIARIGAGYDSLAHALADWRPDPHQESCLLTFTATDVWSVGCAEHFASRGFVPTGETVGTRAVLWTNQPFMLE